MLQFLKKAFLTFPFISIAFTTYGQVKPEMKEEIPYIEITGTAEKEVIPNEIYIGVTIREKFSGKTKVTIEEQEARLKEIFRNLSLNLQDLTLADANADYVKISWHKKDILTKKDYTLKVADAQTVGKVFLELDKIEITDAYISKVAHSRIDSLQQVVKIQAIKNAKNQAEYLLAAIGEQPKEPLIVRETDEIPVYTNAVQGVNVKGTRSGSTAYYVNGVKQSEESAGEIQFQKIRIRSNIYLKYSIK